MDDYAYWTLFFSVALALNISPGPDLLYILSRTIAGGRMVGIASALGVGTGALVHVSAAALGVSAILATSITAFMVVKYIGAAYLIYLGMKSLHHAGTSLDLSSKSTTYSQLSPWKAFRQGVFVDILNPKVAIFFMAFLPQFVRQEVGSVSLQLLGLGLLIILIGIIVEVTFVVLAARASHLLRNNNSIGKWLDRFLGSILIGLGIKLALSERT
jgi:RhtB (resistance to homoserine/threonine) family protein